MKKHAIIPVFIPHLGCPHACVFCDQNQITARNKAPSKDEVISFVETWLTTLDDVETVELAFYGGSFTAIPIDKQIEYLAIAKEFKDAGKVHKIHLSTRPDAIDEEILDNLEAYSVDKYICDDRLSLKTYLAYSYMYDETLVVRPKYWNKRIANQAGLFMFFFNNLVDRYRSVLIHSKEMGVEKAIEEYRCGPVVVKDIENILANESIDFYTQERNKYLSDDYLEVMKERYSADEFWHAVENRFMMRCSINGISKKKLQSRFCSILIDAKSKKKILKELSTVGISADFIYPELEYSSKEIKNMFDV